MATGAKNSLNWVISIAKSLATKKKCISGDGKTKEVDLINCNRKISVGNV